VLAGKPQFPVVHSPDEELSPLFVLELKEENNFWFLFELHTGQTTFSCTVEDL
jgi:hypothetical protein